MIFRYPIEVRGYQELSIPGPAKVLSVARSREAPNDYIDMWVYTEVGEPEWRVPVWIVGTGNLMPPELSPLTPFIGTVVCPNDLVWHVFAKGSK